ncbi:glycosyltransferase family 1 protein [Aureimonas sp. AU4]|uniref:glycosyltransferase family 4 protein n=1 Tax=Aureimonas sp. AU4 TaxID=1638163 RepID=UPI0007826C13|nr:glycosyltransferase family 1 protein [Aureimonas sp. AU4]
MRILIGTDAWLPQVNGVVRTLANLTAELAAMGHEVELVTPADFRTIACPTYPQIRLAWARRQAVLDRLRRFDPDIVHIATEGPIGVQLRAACLSIGKRFTTSFHTRFPEYVRSRAPVPLALSYALLRRFHAPATACLVTTEAMRADLSARGFQRLATWTRGVDLSQFRPVEPVALDLPRPVFVTVSRLAPEKNIEGFLDLDLPGSKLVVGDGPALASLHRRYPTVHFAGARTGEDLVRHYAAGDVFVFPSRTDTFGIVLIEALACGLPFAAFPEPGPVEIAGTGGAGAVSHDLRDACLRALRIDPSLAIERAQDFTWRACAEDFLAAAETCRRARPLPEMAVMAA